jgi:hypothetical protein
VAEPGPFEAFYASALQHPMLLWLAAAIGLAIALSRRDRHASVHRYAVVLFALSVLDAWLTASHVYGIGALPGGLASAVPIFFVIAGDARYLLFVEAAMPEGAIAITPRALARALPLSLLVPVSALAIATLLGAPPRVLFLTHELLFCALALALLRWHPNVRALPWLRIVTRFVLLYYALWVAADVILLATSADLGFALRVVPNLLYYGGLIAAIEWFAPPPAAR